MTDHHQNNIYVDFHKVQPGKEYFKILELPIDSQVVKYERCEVTNPVDHVFCITKTVVESAHEAFKILFKPLACNTSYIEYFYVTTSAFEKKILYLKGETIGPNVTSPTTQIIFSVAKKELNKSLILTNNSEMDAYFSFDIDVVNSPVIMSPLCGKIKRKESTRILSSYIPKSKGFTCFKVFCLVKDQEPIAIEVRGSNQKEAMNIDFSDYIYSQDPLPRYLNNYEAYLQDVVGRLFTESRPVMTLDRNCIDFGQLLLERASETFTLTSHSLVLNHILWEIDEKCYFRIEPVSAKILPDMSIQFTAIFEPTIPERLYHAQIKGYINWGSNCDFLVPFSISMNLLGHTFNLKKSSWDPSYNLEYTRFVLPATTPLAPAYCSFKLENTGCLPLMYKFLPPKNSHFNIKPVQGLLTEGFQICIVRILPGFAADCSYAEKWKLILNGIGQVSIVLCATAELPFLKIAQDRIIKFSPTNINSIKQIDVPIRNSTRLYIRFDVSTIEEPFSCDKEIHLIKPNELINIKMNFYPKEVANYQKTVRFNLNVGDPPVKTYHTSSIVIVEGICSAASISAAPPYLELGDVLLNNWAQGVFFIENSGDCEAYISLRCSPSTEGAAEEKTAITPQCLSLLPKEKREMIIQVCPSKVGLQHLQVLYAFHPTPDFEKNCSIEGIIFLLDVNLYCSYPLFRIVDIRLINFSRNFSKYCLWKMLQINNFNRSLLNLNLGNSKKSVYMKVPLNEVGSPTTAVQLLFKNITCIPVRISIKYEKSCNCKPIEKNVGISFRQIDYVCKHAAEIQFIVKKDVFQAREEGIIELYNSYQRSDKYIFLFELTVTPIDDPNLKVTMSLIVERRCSKKDTGMLDFYCPGPNRKIFLNLDPVFVGDPCKPIQAMWLYNNSGEEVGYMMELQDPDPKLTIFEVINPESMLAPLSLHPILIKFTPYQFKLYEACALVYVEDIQFTIILRGQGVCYPCTNTYSMLQKCPTTSSFHQTDGVHVSLDHIQLKPMLLHSCIKRMVFLKNHTTDEVQFFWVQRRFGGILHLRVVPTTGILSPGEILPCLVHIQTLSLPARLTCLLCVRFTNMRKKAEWSAKLKNFKESARRFDACFITTETADYLPTPVHCKLGEKPTDSYFNIAVSIHSLSEKELDMVLPSYKEQLQSLAQYKIDSVVDDQLEISVQEADISIDVLTRVIWEVLNRKVFLKSISTKRQGIYYRDIKEVVPDEPKLKPQNRFIHSILNASIYSVLINMFSLTTEMCKETYITSSFHLDSSQFEYDLHNKYYSDIMQCGLHRVSSRYSEGSIGEVERFQSEIKEDVEKSRITFTRKRPAVPYKNKNSINL